MSYPHYTVGEFAKICHTTARTLKYYDQIGLLHPSHIGENGYRYYTMDQMDTLSSIFLYRDFGYSLDEISKRLQKISLEDHLEAFQEQAQIVRNRIAELEKQKQELDSIVGEIQAAQKMGSNPFIQEMCFRYHSIAFEDISGVIASSYLTQGLHSGTIFNPENGEPTHLYRVSNNGALLLKGPCLVRYVRRASNLWQDTVEHMRAAAKETGNPITEVFSECIVENPCPEPGLYKLFMKL